MAEKEYIERGVLLEQLNKKKAETGKMRYTEGFNDAIMRVRSMVNSASTADVAPVVHGEWDEIPNVYMSVASKNGSHSSNATSCSACQEVNPNAYRTNYCPNCGAKMDGGKANE